jgi:succinoglycan biosynthesis protein ExoO
MNFVRQPSTAGAHTPRKPHRVAVLTRQRVTGPTSGSTAYLLAICQVLHDAGMELHLICPTKGALGRQPVLRMGKETKIFASVSYRGTWRIGRWHLAVDPRIVKAAVIGVADRILRRRGISFLARWARPFPYGVALPWTGADLLYVAQKAQGRADAALADYGFLTPAIPHALRPGGKSAVVMHDLFSSRGAQFQGIGSSDSVASLTEAEEMRLLGGADAVIAIQAREAAIVASHLPHAKVILAPMPATPGEAPAPGQGQDVLFVGTGTAPNVDGMNWFLDEVWPSVRAAVTGARLLVAGGVCDALGTHPGARFGVRLLGRVPDLAPLYRDAAVVVSPLRAGSGLKIKLIEALSHGKAVVATSVTAQGVEEILGNSVAITDDAQNFAREIVALLGNPALRRERGEAALAVARSHFSPEACLGGVVDFFLGRERLRPEQSVEQVMA